MSAIVLNANPVENDILKNIVGHLEIPDLKSFRLVSTQWKSQATLQMRKNHKPINLSAMDSKRIEEFTAIMLKSVQLPFSSFELDVSKFADSELRVSLSKFFGKCGSHVRHLNLQNLYAVKILPSDVRDILFFQARQLETLRLYAPILNVDSVFFIPRAQLPHLTKLGLAFFHDEGEESLQHLENYYRDFFIATCNLEQLIYSNWKSDLSGFRKAILESDVYKKLKHLEISDTTLTAFVQMSRNGMKLKSLKVENNDENSNVFAFARDLLLILKDQQNTLQELSIRFRGEGRLENFALPMLTELRSLKFDAYYEIDQFMDSVFSLPKLTSLTLSNDNGDDSCRLVLPEQLVTLKYLKNFHVSNLIIDDASYFTQCFENLTNLKLDFCRRVPYDELWSQLPNLEQLDLIFSFDADAKVDAVLMGLSSEEWEKLQKLTKMITNENADILESITLTPPLATRNSIYNMKKLASLAIKGSYLNDRSLTDVAFYFLFPHMTQLRHLKINFMEDDVSPYCVEFLKQKLPELDVLIQRY